MLTVIGTVFGSPTLELIPGTNQVTSGLPQILQLTPTLVGLLAMLLVAGMVYSFTRKPYKSRRKVKREVGNPLSRLRNSLTDLF